jgi:ribosomal protein L29
MKAIKDLKLKQIDDLRKMDATAFKKELEVTAKKLFELNMKKELNELKQTHLIKALRRHIAVIKTVALEKGVNLG